MTNSRLTLISHPLCPFVQRVAIVLREKHIPFEQVQIDLNDKPAWFLAISPAGKVPLLKVERDADQTVVLFESMAICEYLEEAYRDHGIHPAAPLARAQHRAWIEFSSATLVDAWGYLNAVDETVAATKAADLRKKLERFEAVLSDKPYFAGAGFSMVDAVTAPVFRYFDILGDDVPPDIFGGLNHVASWRRALAERPSVRDAVMADYGARFRTHLKDHAALLASG
jgi:glutathione S-transferase